MFFEYSLINFSEEDFVVSEKVDLLEEQAAYFQLSAVFLDYCQDYSADQYQLEQKHQDLQLSYSPGLSIP